MISESVVLAVNDSNHLRERPAEMRMSSKELKDDNTAGLILRLVELYDRLADPAEVRGDGGVPLGKSGGTLAAASRAAIDTRKPAVHGAFPGVGRNHLPSRRFGIAACVQARTGWQRSLSIPPP